MGCAGKVDGVLTRVRLSSIAHIQNIGAAFRQQSACASSGLDAACARVLWSSAFTDGSIGVTPPFRPKKQELGDPAMNPFNQFLLVVAVLAPAAQATPISLVTFGQAGATNFSWYSLEDR